MISESLAFFSAPGENPNGPTTSSTIEYTTRVSYTQINESTADMMTRAAQPPICDRGIVDYRVPLQIRNATDPARPSLAERVFTVVMLFYTTGAVLPFITGGTEQENFPQIRLADLAVKAALYAVTFFLILLQWRSFIRGLLNMKWLLLLLLIAIASTLWSQDPSLTLRGSAVLLGTTAFGVYFGTRYTVPEQLRLLAWTCFLTIAFSYVIAIFLPRYGIDQDSNFGDWQGAFVQKNGLAEAAVLAVLVFLFVRPVGRALRWLGIAASFALLLLSRSATGRIVCLGITATLPLYKLTRARFTAVIPITLGVGLLLVGSVLVLKTHTAEALQLVNRSPDLTGRIDLWGAVLVSISKRPWLGYGFSAFWQGMNGESGSVLDTAGWLAWYAHNGFLDLMLQLGVLGLVTFAVGYLVVWRRALAFLSRTTGPVPIWLCTFLLFMLLYNLTEGSILTQNDIYWVLYISTAVSLFPVSSPRNLRRVKRANDYDLQPNSDCVSRYTTSPL
jgi:exopolysaccharide production protein ExoQ